MTTQIKTGVIADAQVTEVKLLLADNTTNNVSTARHGLMPKLPNQAFQFLNGVGNYVQPPFTQSYTSTQQTITGAGALTLAHGLGVAPKLIICSIVCQIAEAGYSINDEVFVNVGHQSSTVSNSVSVVPDATNLNIRYSNYTNVFIIVNKSTGANGILTNGNWKFVIRAFA